jgi:hypothetical protein
MRHTQVVHHACNISLLLACRVQMQRGTTGQGGITQRAARSLIRQWRPIFLMYALILYIKRRCNNTGLQHFVFLQRELFIIVSNGLMYNRSNVCTERVLRLRAQYITYIQLPCQQHYKRTLEGGCTIRYANEMHLRMWVSQIKFLPTVLLLVWHSLFFLTPTNLSSTNRIVIALTPCTQPESLRTLTRRVSYLPCF